jgi:uncharacterized protein DUF4242
MKVTVCLAACLLAACSLLAQTGEQLYIDVHHLGPGKVTPEAVAGAHAKDLAVEGKYGVHFINYWVDTAGGIIYCLSSAPDTMAIRKTHAEAHGLVQDETWAVTSGTPSPKTGQLNYYLDIHRFASPVAAADVAAAHRKDLAVEGKYGVNFINYWVSGTTVVCLSQAPDPDAVIRTHKEAHGLVPVSITQVTPGDK